MDDSYFTPVAITKVIASALPVRHGYTTLVYRLSTPVSSAWIVRFEACGGSYIRVRPGVAARAW